MKWDSECYNLAHLNRTRVERRLLTKRPKSWEKSPDAPLGEIIQYTLQRRMKLGTGDPGRDAARLERVRRRIRQSAG